MKGRCGRLEGCRAWRDRRLARRGGVAAAVAVALLVIALAGAGCRNLMPTNRYLQPRQGSSAAMSTSEARRKFDHALHAKPLATAQLICVDCHQFGVKIESDGEDLAKAVSAHAQTPGSAACHSCHVDQQLRMSGAPAACLTCHDNLLPLMPRDHQVGWLKAHATVANINPTQCESCHRQSFCADCHARRDSVDTRVHERNFRFYHSVQARANPLQCNSCHRADFCINCHQQGKVE